MKGYLILEDGTQFEGEIFGAIGETVGEVVFNTGMTGYEEIISDPSYYGQIVILTYPLIGNYGINLDDLQSDGPKIKGLIVREFVEDYSNWRGKENLSDYLEQNNIVGIEGLDTRALVKHIRDKGTMLGTIVKSCDRTQISSENLVKGQAILERVTTPAPYDIPGDDLKVAVLDFGIKRNILESFVLRNISVRVFPAFTEVAEILAYEPDGIFLSNGPGNPEDYGIIVDHIKDLAQVKPIFGICLGHQLVAMAMGAKTEKLKFGHRGSNHPVKDIFNNKIVITSQNHGYVVTEDSLQSLPVTVTHLNLNDQSIEGIKHNDLPIFSVQYHPEASPGPGDSSYLFDNFVSLMKEAK